ncbi:acylphosphatase-2-like [Rhynchophorus ferrugineus]|uniref:acylphosphatase n=1 Tax=Rhynchophorus ferrugineus TaxID=354439 RepID=A0A834IGC5_RHYFE|nr:hypothetical protein GWI33_005583 [Rhynchophorus ferrugineus]
MDDFLNIWGCFFKIEGIVQGVSFRRHTKQEAKRLGIRGYCMNSKNSSVVGEIQGPLDRYMKMKAWLTHVGSPLSRIENAEFQNERLIFNYTYPQFRIKSEDNDPNAERLLNADDSDDNMT